MHGRIFVVDTKEDMKKREYFYEAPWEDYKMADFIPGCDYVSKQEEDSKSDFEWFATAYDLEVGQGKDIEMQEIGLEDEKFVVTQVKVKPLVEALKKEKESKLNEIRDELAKPVPNLWQIHYTAWSNSGFWFIYPDYGFGPEMELLDWRRNKKLEEIYITESYDFHT